MIQNTTFFCFFFRNCLLLARNVGLLSSYALRNINVCMYVSSSDKPLENAETNLNIIDKRKLIIVKWSDSVAA